MLLEELTINENSESIDSYHFSEEYPNFMVNSGIFLSFARKNLLQCRRFLFMVLRHHGLRFLLFLLLISFVFSVLYRISRLVLGVVP